VIPAPGNAAGAARSAAASDVAASAALFVCDLISNPPLFNTGDAWMDQRAGYIALRDAL
jgi:hypothetical protein